MTRKGNTEAFTRQRLDLGTLPARRSARLRFVCFRPILTAEPLQFAVCWLSVWVDFSQCGAKGRGWPQRHPVPEFGLNLRLADGASFWMTLTRPLDTLFPLEGVRDGGEGI